MARTMLREYNLPLYFWMEAVNTSFYITNRVFKRSILNKTFMSFGTIENPKSHIQKYLDTSTLY